MMLKDDRFYLEHGYSEESDPLTERFENTKLDGLFVEIWKRKYTIPMLPS
jgi:hypothetical protein